MSRSPIRWDAEVERLDADPVATLTVDRSTWENVGASFTAVDDGQGETPGLAMGSAPLKRGRVPFGVLDYGADTYLLIPGDGESRMEALEAVLDALERAGIPDARARVVDVARAGVVSLEERVAALELHVSKYEQLMPRRFLTSTLSEPPREAEELRVGDLIEGAILSESGEAPVSDEIVVEKGYVADDEPLDVPPAGTSRGRGKKR